MSRPSHDAAFSTFVREHRVDLLRSACLLTAGDRHAAEDLVQIALARLYVVWSRVARPDQLLPYARRIVVNAYLDETRRPRWRRERSVAEPSEVADQRYAVDGGPADPGDGDRIRAALRALPPRMRAVVVLRHWLDLGVEETAAVLGCSTGTVKSQTSKATARLRELLVPTAVPTAVPGSVEGTESLRRSIR